MFFPKVALSNVLATAKNLLAPCVAPNDSGGSSVDPKLSKPTNEGSQRTWVGHTTGTVYREADNPPFVIVDRHPTGRKYMYDKYRKTWDELGLESRQRRVDVYDEAVADGDLPALSEPVMQ